VGRITRALNRTGARGKPNQEAQKNLDETDKELDKIENASEKSGGKK